MAHHFRLDKVLMLREKEKNLAEIEFSNAQQRFESVARALYDFLKKKEDLERQYEHKMSAGVQIDRIRQYNLHLQSLHNSIIQKQQQVNRARFEMEEKRRQIIEQSVEVKKYSRLKEKHTKKALAKIKRTEANQLDELTMLKLGERYGV